MTGQLALADDLWCLAFEPLTNRRELNERALALGMAGALLIELVGTSWATVDNGFVTCLDARPFAPAEPATPGGDATPKTVPLTRAYWNAIVAEHDRHPIKNWLEVLAATAVADVTERLVEKGVVAFNHADQMRTNYNLGERSRAENRIRHCLTHVDRGYFLSPQDEVLLGLAEVVGLGKRLTAGLPEQAADYHAWVMENLPTNYPPHFAIVIATQDAVAALTATRR